MVFYAFSRNARLCCISGEFEIAGSRSKQFVLFLASQWSLRDKCFLGRGVAPLKTAPALQNSSRATLTASPRLKIVHRRFGLPCSTNGIRSKALVYPWLNTGLLYFYLQLGPQCMKHSLGGMSFVQSPVRLIFVYRTSRFLKPRTGTFDTNPH